MSVPSYISIIAPVYNTSPYLARCVNSVLAQTYKNWTLLLVDDGSTDNSGLICDEFAAQDSRICVFHKQNGGVSSARNLGLDKVKTPFLTFLDTDDYVGPEYLEDMMRTGDADLGVTGYLIHNGSEVGNRAIDVVETIPDLIGMLRVRQELGWLGRLRMKASIVNEYRIRFNENYKIMEDECFVSEYLYHSNSVFVKPSYHYHYFASDMTSKYAEKWNDDVYFDIAHFIFGKLGNADTESFAHAMDIRSAKKFYLVAMYKSYLRALKIGNSEKAKNYASQLKQYTRNWPIYPRLILFNLTSIPLMKVLLKFEKV